MHLIPGETYEGAYGSQASARSGDDGDLAFGGQSWIGGVNGGIKTAVHALSELKGGCEHVDVGHLCV